MGELVYGCSGDQALGALVYAPESAPVGAVVDVHGGAWYRGDKAHGAHYCTELARRGWLVVAPDFRDASLSGQHPQACQDITACVRYLRTHASHFGIAPERISLLGSSSGGHLAMLSALRADASEFAGTLINANPPGVEPRFVASGATAAVNGVVALWPVADPLMRYRYAQQHNRTELLAGHDAYFGTEQAMQRAAVARIVANSEALQLPPLFIVQAGADANVPTDMHNELTQTYQQAAGAVHCAYYPNMPHGFACRAGGLTDRCIHDVHGFLHSCLIPVQPKPTRADV